MPANPAACCCSPHFCLSHSLPVCVLFHYQFDQSTHRWRQPNLLLTQRPAVPIMTRPAQNQHAGWSSPFPAKAGGCSSGRNQVSQTAVWWSNTVCDSTCSLSTSAWELACNGNCGWFIKQRSQSIFTFMSGQHPVQQQQPAGGGEAHVGQLLRRTCRLASEKQVLNLLKKLVKQEEWWVFCLNTGKVLGCSSFCTSSRVYLCKLDEAKVTVTDFSTSIDRGQSVTSFPTLIAYIVT